MSAPPKCRFCHTPLTITMIDLGSMPLANSFISDAQAAVERRFPLHVRVCPACLLVQASDSVPPDGIFSEYAYFSSYADSWVEHARRYAEMAISRFQLKPDSLVVEVASNDGYLLQHFQASGVPVLGIEPAANVAQVAIDKGIATEVIFFGAETAKRLAAEGKQADLIAANNVLGHVPDIRAFVAGFALLLKPEGIVTFEFPHLLNLIREAQFDTIYHEHFSYLSLLALDHVFAETGLQVVDVEELPTHGGSLRLYVARQDSSYVLAQSVDAMRTKEKDAALDRPEGYVGLAERAKTIRDDFLGFVAAAKAEGKKIAAYGAAAKGNTFLNYCGVTQDDIGYVFDRSKAKQGRLLPGSHIPILTPEELIVVKPDYLVILPWNLISEITAVNSALRSWGGQFVVAIPHLRVF